MVIKPSEKKKYTYDDYMKTSDDERYELIEGDLIRLLSPTTKHQRVSGNIMFQINEFVESRNLGEIFHGPLDVVFDNENVMQPDILFISKKRMDIIGEKNIQGAPDLVIEIISESTAYRDLVQKKKLYARFGVKEYWIVIPEESSVEIYSLKDNAFMLHKSYDKEDTVKSPLLQKLKIELKKIF
jgi:Uma2 family endonuclease